MLPLRFRSFRSVLAALCAATACAASTSLGAATPSIRLDVTASASDLDLATCGGDTVVSVSGGQQVKFCYRVTNTGDVVLTRHDITDSGFGPMFQFLPETLAPGESFFKTRIATINQSQVHTATWTARSAAPAYTITNSNEPGGPAYAFTDISTSGTPLTLGDDACSDAVDMGFEFSYFLMRSTEVHVCNNGTIVFGNEWGYDSPGNQSLPAPYFPSYRIHPLWDDLSNQNGGVYTQTRGTAPNREFVAQWHQRPFYASPAPPVSDNVTFQAILFEGSQRIEFQYLDATVAAPAAANHGGSATVGLSAATLLAAQFSYNAPVLADHMAIRFTPTPEPYSATATATVAIRVRAPHATLNATTLAGTTFTGGSDHDVLTIGNVGDETMQWRLFEAPSAVASSARSTARVDAPASIAAAGKATRSGPAKLAPARATGALRESPFGAGATAYAVELLSKRLHSFALNAPAAAAPIGNAFTQDFFAGAFVENDFTQLYAINGGDTDTNHFYRIDTATAAVTDLGVSTPRYHEIWTGMAYDLVTHTLYASAYEGANSTLYTINRANGQATWVGTIGPELILDIAINGVGQIYGVSVQGNLVAIDKTTARGTVVGPLGVSPYQAQGLAFNKATNVLYWPSFSNDVGAQLYTIDVTTGQATLIGPFADPLSMEFDAFDIAAPAAGCAVPGDVPWLRLSATSGMLAQNAQTQVTVTYDATGLANGSYDALLCFTSTAPNQPFVPIPVNLVVTTPPDSIFANGFEDRPGLDEGFENVASLFTGVNPWLHLNRSAPSAGTRPSWAQNESNMNPPMQQAGSPNSSIITGFWASSAADGPGGTASDWLITPEIDFTPGMRLSFWTRAFNTAVFTNRLEARLCTTAPCTNVGSTATSVGDFGTLLVSVNPNLLTGDDPNGQHGYPDVAYSRFTVTGLPASGRGRIAFRYFVPDSGNRASTIALDSVSIRVP